MTEKNSHAIAIARKISPRVQANHSHLGYAMHEAGLSQDAETIAAFCNALGINIKDAHDLVESKLLLFAEPTQRQPVAID